ncbi:MAG: tRNA (adenosine(37)-N6)-threonylcarbamoyltransferase complex transferase subunit TsaD [Chloroflexi bacterium]|nr:tRNA (adenosine(37)-N6)-threonylcarbamoyltransferase complex transferase subunit TsaD [Chloroflexota bacterium]
MNILSIETSCDETAAAVVANGRHLLANVVASQIEIHQKYGGIVPEVASRQQVVWIVPVLRETLEQAGLGWDAIDAVAVTFGPGLAGSLLVGVNAAKAVAFARKKDLVAVNHLEGHIYANWLIPPGQPSDLPEPAFPLVGLIVSGGHTDLILMTGHGEYKPLGRTRDDAAGEAFDKVARLLGLGYPGGPIIQRCSEEGNSQAAILPRAWLPGTYDFSFSGLKTAVMRKVEQPAEHRPRRLRKAGSEAGDRCDKTVDSVKVADIAAAFQESVADVLATKTARAAKEYGARQILLAGGVAANSALRRLMVERAEVPVYYPPPSLCTDNAAMIGAAAFYLFEKGLQRGWDLDIKPNLPLVSP